MSSASFEDPVMQSMLENIAKKEHFDQPKFVISWGSKPGDNYCGRIYRTVITETNPSKNRKSLSLIVKASPLSEARREILKTDSLFCTETFIYHTVLPILNNILNKYGVVKTELFPGTARCYASDLENSTKVLVFEDKCTDGFERLRDRFNKSLDVDHCRHILRRLALWHAASLALAYHAPEIAQRLKNSIPKLDALGAFNGPILGEMRDSAKLTLELLQKSFPEGTEMYEKLENIVQNYPEKFVAANEIPSDLSTLIHGDCWFNNFLFKYKKDGSLQDACLIDLQVSRFASPVVDISYMIFVGTTKEVRDESYDELILFYHNEVSSLLRTMDCDPEQIIPWTLLQEHLKKYSMLGVLIAFAGLRVCLLDSADIKVNLQVADGDDTIFIGKAETGDPKKLEEISKRTTEVIADAARWGYI